MIRVSMFYPHASEGHFDLDYFLSRHVPLIESLLTPEGLMSIEVDHGMAMADPQQELQFTAVLHLSFQGYEEMQTAMGSHSGELKEDMHNFSKSIPTVQISRIVYKATMNPVEV